MVTTAARSGRRVFLSYAYDDVRRAEMIAAALAQAGITATNPGPVETTTGSVVKDRLTDAIRASDVVIVLFSAGAAHSPWVRWELDQVASGKLRQRGVDVIPARLDHTPLPPELADRHVVDLAADFDIGLQELVAHVDTATRIDFKRLTPEAFELLVAELLTALGLDVDRASSAVDLGVDLRASRQVVDPFRAVETETWLVECKLYGRGRISVDVIRQIAGYLATAPVTTRGLLVSTAQITSVARDYLAELERTARVRLRVLDGAELTVLLREHPDIAARHFPSADGPDELA
jgi:hypothetical protein